MILRMVIEMRIEKVSNGWVIYGYSKPEYASEILGVFNSIDDLTNYIKSFYEDKESK